MDFKFLIKKTCGFKKKINFDLTKTNNPFTMKTRIYILVFALLSMYSYSQTIFYESFNGIKGSTAGGPGTYKFPTGWLLRNVDNLTPNSQVAYVKNAWERREDFKFTVKDSCAFSTSWYGPAGTSDDWMWTPKITLPDTSNPIILSWRGVAYDPLYMDGYEVRIMLAPNEPTGGNGQIGNQVTASTILTSVTAENVQWTNRDLDISAYKNKEVRIAYRNNSSDKFLLLIDDVKVFVKTMDDVGLIKIYNNEYTTIPIAQATGFGLGATIKNFGANVAINTRVKASIIDVSDNSVYKTVYSDVVASLASNQSADVIFPNYNIDKKGKYFVKYEVENAQDTDSSNNGLTSEILDVTQSVMARDNGEATGQLGIGAGTLGYLGQSFVLNHQALATGGTISFSAPKQGGTYQLALWNVNTQTNKPNQIIAETQILKFENAEPLTTSLSFVNGPKLLQPGKYVLTAVERDSTLSISQTAKVFTPGTTFVKWAGSPGGDWAHNEDFGSTFAKTFAIRLDIPSPKPDAAGNLYVSKDVDGDGSSADNPIGEFADALVYTDAINKANAGTIKTISVIGGGTFKPLYRPDNFVRSMTDPQNSFLLPKDVALVGSYDVDAKTLMRTSKKNNKATGITILDGDLGDGVNAHHIVMAVGDVGTTYMKGFGIMSGSNFGNTASLTVNAQSISPTKGAGMYLLNASPTLNFVAFLGNMSDEAGGAIYVENATPTINIVNFFGNIAKIAGAGIYNRSSNSNIVNSAFVSNNILNNVGNGGAIFNDNSSPLILNSTLRGNIAGADAGGIYNTNASSPRIHNSILFENSGGNNGNIFNSGDSVPDIKYSGIGNQLDLNHTFISNDVNNIIDYLSLIPNDNLNIAHDGGNNNLYNTVSYGIIDALEGNRISGAAIDMGVFEIQEGTLSAEVLSKNGFTVYPNPVSNGKIFVKNDHANQAQIFDVSGKLLKTVTLEKGINTIELNALKKGVYIIRTNDNKSEKIIIK